MQKRNLFYKRETWDVKAERLLERHPLLAAVLVSAAFWFCIAVAMV